MKIFLLCLLALLGSCANAFVVVPTPARRAPHLIRSTVRKSPSFDGLFFSTTPETPTTTAEPTSNTALIGDDAAYFSIQDQKLEDWIKFSVATGSVLAAVFYVWVYHDGPQLGDALLQSVQQSLIHTTDPAVTVFALLGVFAVFHSGLAALRPLSESVIGPRAHRVVFATVSLPLALSCISYFINHCHEGAVYWNVQQYEWVHALCWIMNFVSFLFLYPSTFNLLEIAAIEKPQLHLYETGVVRITRHPQAIGQILWCFAHTLWLGTSVAISASAMLILHHVFSIPHGDYRLQQRHGEDFVYIKSKTSVIPFQAILEGRQELPDDYYKEFLRGPYLIVVGGTLAAYFAHPFMQAGAALLGW